MIITPEDYNNALKLIENLIAKNQKKGTAAYKELDSLGLEISNYEEINFPIDIEN